MTSTPTDPRASGRLRAFGRGFRQRSPLVLAVAAALAVLSVLALQHLALDGSFTAVSQGRFLRIANDDYVHVTYKVAQLRQHPPKGPTIYLFGGSGAMESIISEKSLAHAVRRAGGGPVHVVSLAAHQESLAQTLAIVDNLPPGQAVIAVGLAPSRLTTPPAVDASLLGGSPLLLRSPSLDQLAPRFYGQSASSVKGVLPGMFDYALNYLKARVGAGVLPGASMQYAHHYYPPGVKGATPAEKRANLAAVLAGDRANYDRYAAYNFAVLAQVIKVAKQRGFGVALFDQPLNQAAGAAGWGGLVSRYRTRAEALAHRYDVAYLDVGRDVPLRDADYADLYHLLDRGRAKWQPVLARQLATVLQPAASGPVADVTGGARP